MEAEESKFASVGVIALKHFLKMLDINPRPISHLIVGPIMTEIMNRAMCDGPLGNSKATIEIPKSVVNKTPCPKAGKAQQMSNTLMSRGRMVDYCPSTAATGGC